MIGISTIAPMDCKSMTLENELHSVSLTDMLEQMWSVLDEFLG